VGGACGANPIPVLVPCHRVLAANGKIGGFSGGLDWKRKLLAREVIKF
jgi:O-6-methylguanine DNA methyltransferase